ncbi:MAG: hypothetical protein K0Q52_3536 [Microbacterium sp.]|nr:hypothetical protein [Microbacterium sp.]
MSYDLEVYGKVALPLQGLGAITKDGLALESDTDDQSVSRVVHRPSGEYCFTVEGPFDVADGDPDELPKDLGSDLHYRYLIVVEGSERPHIEHALTSATRLASAVDGMAVDLQADSGATSTHATERKNPDEPERYLHVRWYRRFDEDSGSLAAQYVESAESLLPAALPVAFGLSEPLREKFTRVGLEGFDRLYRDECARRRLVFKGNRPLISGFIDAWSDEFIAELHFVQLVFAASELSRPQFKGALEDFFVDLAQRSKSFFAFAEVSYSQFSPSQALPQWGEWPGLPQSPPWLSWFSTDYAELVRPHLTAGELRSFPGGLLYRSSLSPSSISASWSEPGSWVPVDFVPEQNDPENHRQSTASARTMPAALRSANRAVNVR